LRQAKQVVKVARSTINRHSMVGNSESETKISRRKNNHSVMMGGHEDQQNVNVYGAPLMNVF